MKNPMLMSGAELAQACRDELKKARGDALRILSPAQLTAIEATGSRIVPEWMVAVLLKTVETPTPAGEGGGK